MTPLHIISLGAGVQSSTMALMAAAGLITPMPDCAIFADTGWEPQAVYDHLNWLCSPNVLPFPVHRVSCGVNNSGQSQREHDRAAVRGNSMVHIGRRPSPPPMHQRIQTDANP